MNTWTERWEKDIDLRTGKSLFCAAMIWLASAISAAASEVSVTVIRFDYLTALPVPRVDLKPDDLDLAGATLAGAHNVRVCLNSRVPELAGFNGHQVNFRDWNNQMRREVLLLDGRITVDVSPQKGFLHHPSVLNSLGLDRPETQCTAFN